MSFAIGLLPALLFGSSSVLLMKLGGDSRQQTMGQFFGALGVAIVLVLSVGVDTNPAVLLTAFVAGAVLGVGIGCLTCHAAHDGWSADRGGSSWYRPVRRVGRIGGAAGGNRGVGGNTGGGISCGLERARPSHRVRFCSGFRAAAASVRTGMVIMAISTLFLIAFPTLTRLWSIDPMTSLLPEAIGFVVVGMIATSPRRGMPDTRWSRPTVGALLPGVLWGTGLIVLQYSINVLGVAVGFALSQLTVVVATFWGHLDPPREEDTQRDARDHVRNAVSSRRCDAARIRERTRRNLATLAA